jgi:hypothetical protein
MSEIYHFRSHLKLKDYVYNFVYLLIIRAGLLALLSPVTINNYVLYEPCFSMSFSSFHILT